VYCCQTDEGFIFFAQKNDNVGSLIFKTRISPPKINFLHQNSSFLTYTLYSGPLDAQLTLNSREPVYNSSSKTGICSVSAPRLTTNKWGRHASHPPIHNLHTIGALETNLYQLEKVGGS